MRVVRYERCSRDRGVVIVYIARSCGRTILLVFFFQAEDGIRYLVRSRGLGDVYKRQAQDDPGALHETLGGELVGRGTGDGPAPVGYREGLGNPRGSIQIPTSPLGTGGGGGPIQPTGGKNERVLPPGGRFLPACSYHTIPPRQDR